MLCINRGCISCTLVQYCSCRMNLPTTKSIARFCQTKCRCIIWVFGFSMFKLVEICSSIFCNPTIVIISISTLRNSTTIWVICELYCIHCPCRLNICGCCNSSCVLSITCIMLTTWTLKVSNFICCTVCMSCTIILYIIFCKSTVNVNIKSTTINSRTICSSIKFWINIKRICVSYPCRSYGYCTSTNSTTI